jgi:hypothetical protein
VVSGGRSWAGPVAAQLAESAASWSSQAAIAVHTVAAAGPGGCGGCWATTPGWVGAGSRRRVHGTAGMTCPLLCAPGRSVVPLAWWGGRGQVNTERGWGDMCQPVL